MSELQKRLLQMFVVVVAVVGGIALAYSAYTINLQMQELERRYLESEPVEADLIQLELSEAQLATVCAQIAMEEESSPTPEATQAASSTTLPVPQEIE